MGFFSIAIDGPAGAGKSTVAKEVASRLGFIYVDTGAMYRALALFLLQQQLLPEQEQAIGQAVEQADISIRYQDGEQRVLLNGRDVSAEIRTQQVGNMASAVSVYLPVRQKLVAMQQELAKQADVVMDGRDIGTAVLPGAAVKIYLTASPAVRAKRRYLELVKKGQDCDLAEIEAQIRERDQRDMSREHSPLCQAADAVLVDTSGLDIGAAVSRIIDIARERGLAAAAAPAGKGN